MAPAFGALYRAALRVALLSATSARAVHVFSELASGGGSAEAASPPPGAMCHRPPSDRAPQVEEMLPPAWAEVLQPQALLKQGAYNRIYMAKVIKEGLPRVRRQFVALKVFVAGFGTDDQAELEAMRQSVDRELEATRALSGPSYATVYKAQNVTYDHKGVRRPGMLIAMELGDSTLHRVVARPAVDKLARRKHFLDRMAIFVKMLRGLSEMHDKGYYHRDLTTDNVILLCKDTRELSTCEPKLIDFGNSCYFKAGSSCDTSDCGTREYKAPDGRADDVWAAAVVMREMLVGSLPSSIAKGTPRYYNIFMDHGLDAFRREFPKWFMLMWRMLVEYRQDRISMQEASEIANELFETTFGAERPNQPPSLASGYAKVLEAIPDVGHVIPVEAAAAAA